MFLLRPITLTKEHLLFVKGHSNGRLKSRTLRFYEQANRYEIICYVLRDCEDQIVSVSACGVIDGKSVYSITVTHEEFRRRGYGSITMGAKIKECDDKGIIYETRIAKDNEGSIAIALKSDLVVLREEIGRRTRNDVTEEYTVLVFGSKDG